jgi:hypothetical protein
LNYDINPKHPNITKLTKAHINGLQLNAIKAKATKIKADEAMQHCFRDIKSNIPAAFQFTDAMKQAVAHTQMMLQSARSGMIAMTDPKRKLVIPFKVGDKVTLSTKNIRMVHPCCNKLLPIWAGPLQDDKGLWRTDEGQLVIPTVDLRRMAMEACHDSVFSGHFGPTRTINLVQRLFYWPEMAHHIRTYCNECNVCQRTKSSNQKPFGQLRPLPVPRNKWTNVTVDMITGLPMTARGYNAIIVFVDRLTKMVHLVPTTEKLTARGFAEMLMTNIIRLHGCPDNIVSDRGSIFNNKFEKEFLKGIHCEPHFSSAYHPQSDGQTERANQVLEQVLRSYASLDHSEWDTFLPMAEFAMNNAPNEAT